MMLTSGKHLGLKRSQELNRIRWRQESNQIEHSMEAEFAATRLRPLISKFSRDFLGRESHSALFEPRPVNPADRNILGDSAITR